jgi:peptidoglycan/LPS O-acetylase OafA/YrhL
MNNVLYRSDIDGLRAIAILPVVAFHAFPRYAPGGFIGVDIFFVISGYLISSIIFRSLLSNNFSFSEFYARRVRRIFPALIVVLATCYALGWFVLLPDEFKMLGKHIAAGAGFVQNIILQREAGYFDFASELKPLLHLWSLAVEEQFYLVFPVFAWLLWRARLNLLTGVALVALISFMLSQKGMHADAVKAFFWPHTRFWELMAGAILAYVHVFRAWPEFCSHALRLALFNRVVFRQAPKAEHQGDLLRTAASFVGLALILASIAAYSAKTPWPGSRAIAPVLGATLLIAAGPQAWVNRKLLAAKPMVWIGLISYPLYLWHWPLLSFLRIIEGGMPAREWRIGAVLLSFALAALTHWLIEKPVRYGERRAWKNMALCLALALVGYIGYDAFQRDGLAFRMNEETIERNKETIEAVKMLFDEKNRPWRRENQDLACKTRFPFAEKFLCRINRDESPSIVVLGDSHSVSLYPGLVEALSQSSYPATIAGVGANGCVGFRDVWSYDRKTPEPDRVVCRNIINQVLDAAKAPSVKTVLIVSRGPLYLSGKGFAPDDFANEKRHDRILTYPPRPELTNHAEIWEFAMHSTLTELTAAGKRVIFVLDNPELGFDPKTCIGSRLARILSNNVRNVRNPCAVSRAAFDERNRDYRALVMKVLREFPQAVLVDGAKPFCDDEYCWGIKDGKLLYYDDDHVSLEGARLIAREIIPYLVSP